MKSSKHNYHKQILPVTSAFVLTASLMMMVMTGGGGWGIMPTLMTQHEFAQTVGETSQGGYGQQPDNITTTAGGATNATTATMTNGTTIGGEAPMIKMMPKEVNGTYRWAINDTINPTITLVANVNNTITVDNPTDEVHELVIAMAQGGGEIAPTGDIQPNGHGELPIMPNATESLQYHCQYHPQTMLGDIRITNAPTMTNQTQ